MADARVEALFNRLDELAKAIDEHESQGMLQLRLSRLRASLARYVDHQQSAPFGSSR